MHKVKEDKNTSLNAFAEASFPTWTWLVIANILFEENKKSNLITKEMNKTNLFYTYS